MTRFIALASVLGALAVSGLAHPFSGDAVARKRQLDHHIGNATSYTPSGVGACGVTISPDQFAVALAPDFFTASSSCSENLTVTNANTGVTKYALVLDECDSCTGQNLELTVPLYEALGGSLSHEPLEVIWY
ncbi:predicted protein [Postia placenta Mad-698-R]|uniref:RlpA-like protein double-psi beta-barrel domain-containing protein n=1 Tax=Postia placenta MAD-698-R-SB12 TaxID=670580 RepID=A0A1X6ML41_9APHY|nr:hypothetical protein POSPLADRAFT_1186246 [Postia placenta MAD-698-R-SB12]EED81773.1 predicted protein [Postia placenta Mad-698-R]OSX56956.1 hypothetical protein POSPLADRAFT_1186246 [Postia placenta MAD-698-R-SB12]